jgi:hypothetical protein
VAVGARRSPPPDDIDGLVAQGLVVRVTHWPLASLALDPGEDTSLFQKQEATRLGGFCFAANSLS